MVFVLHIRCNNMRGVSYGETRDMNEMGDAVHSPNNL